MKLNEEIKRCIESELYYRSIAAGSGSRGSSKGTAQDINILLP